MSKIVLIDVFLSICSFSCFAQHWEKSYIINLQNDTLFGFVNSNKYSFWEKILFKETENDKHRVYYSNELKVYSYNNEIYYSIHLPKTITGIESYTFAKRIIEGNITLFHSKYRYSACSCEPEGAIGNGYILLKKNEMLIVQKKSLNRKIKNKDEFSEFLSDNEELSSKILNNQVDFNDIPKILVLYNEAN